MTLMGQAFVSPTLDETALHMSLCVCLLSANYSEFKWVHLEDILNARMHFSSVMW